MDFLPLFNESYRKTMLRLLSEAPQKPETAEGEDDAEDVVPEEGDAPPGGDIGGDSPIGGGMGDGPMGGADGQPPVQPTKPVSREEFFLAQLALKALRIDPSTVGIDPKVYDAFEDGKDLYTILKYIDRKVNKVDLMTAKDEMSVVDKLRHLRKVSHKNKRLPVDRLHEWVKIILNVIKNPSDNDTLLGTEVTNENVGQIFDRLRNDYGFNVKGMDKGMDISQFRG